MRFRAGNSEGLVVFPENTDLKSTDGWLELAIPEAPLAGNEGADMSVKQIA
jgi:hypothetical protein